uniref:Uncharacterized protein n=1 Tax=Amphimedon queenslandica TaxID=400682 RepID=A0A1X7UCR1_AMPQE
MNYNVLNISRLVVTTITGYSPKSVTIYREVKGKHGIGANQSKTIITIRLN